MKALAKIALSEAAAAGKRAAAHLKDGDILALSGPLGSGKTTFTKALCSALGVRSAVSSPTFVLLNRYPARLKHKAVYFYHLDLYRAKNFREIKALGITEAWGKPGTLTVIEWANKIKRHLPAKTKLVTFYHQ